MRQNRTDRLLITLALLTLLLAGATFYFDSWTASGRRDRGKRIGVVKTRSGDVRVRFENDHMWQKAAVGADLMYNDAIYAGATSEADLTLGESSLKVTENTLVILRRQKDVSFLNLNYGRLLGRIAENEKFIFDTFDGKSVEFVAEKGTQIVLSKTGGKTRLEVTSGGATVDIDGRQMKVDRDTPLILEDQTPQESRSLPNYVWKLYDVFHISGKVLVEKRNLPEKMSADGTLVTPQFLESARPSFGGREEIVALKRSPSVKVIHLTTALHSPLGFVVQGPSQSVEELTASPARWSYSSSITLPVPDRGQFFYRFRTISLAQEVSPWSDALELLVEPPRSPMPTRVLARHRPNSKSEVPLSPRADLRSPSSNENLSTGFKEQLDLAIENPRTTMSQSSSARERIPMRAWITTGGGVNFVYFKQSMASDNPASYAGFNASEISLSAGFLHHRTGLELSYAQLNGLTSSIDSTSVSERRMWPTYSATGLYELTRGSLLGHPAVTRARLGYQKVMLPFFYVDDSQLRLCGHTVGSAAAGGDVEVRGSDRIQYQLFMRYLHPVSSNDECGRNFSATPRLSFDGSIGGRYAFSSRWNLGLYWFGQWYQYKYELNQGNGSRDGGEKSVVYSNVELRLGVDF